METKVELVTFGDRREASDAKDIEKAAMIIRAYGHSTWETLLATPWKQFLSGCNRTKHIQLSVLESLKPGPLFGRKRSCLFTRRLWEK